MTNPKDLTSMEETIETYILNEMGGSVYGICGFSMGATIGVEFIGKGDIFCFESPLRCGDYYRIGFYGKIFDYAFIIGTRRIKNKKPIPKFLLDKLMGKDNLSVIEMTYTLISKNTIKNACKFIYHYKPPKSLSKFLNPVLFWRGR